MVPTFNFQSSMKAHIYADNLWYAVFANGEQGLSIWGTHKNHLEGWFQQWLQSPVPWFPINRSRAGEAQELTFLTCFQEMLMLLAWDCTLNITDITACRVLWHLAQHGHQGTLLGRDAPKSCPKWFSVVWSSHQGENHTPLLTKLNGHLDLWWGCTYHNHHAFLIWTRIL